ncbi:MAG: hypothetical protein KJ063_05550 [Anaerolineae bacterium]|nr:hypothetical protein [Anaerolineae bacterium]
MKVVRPFLAVLLVLLLGWLFLAALLPDGSSGALQAGPDNLTPHAYLPVAFNPAATATPTATPPPSSPPWLSYVNMFRVQANIPLVVENSSWSNGGWQHGRYMVKNDVITHSQDPNNPWYTPEGHTAAQNGNVAVSSSVSATDYSAINLWMVGPFHAVGIIDPKLHTTGFGHYHENIGTWKSGATLDVLRGRGGVPGGVTFPVYYPKNGGQLWLLSYGGGEYPDPVAGCGYSLPTGGPIILQLGPGNVTPNVTAYSLTRQGQPVNVCVYDETTYSFPGNPSGQSLGRSVLNGRDAIVMMPQQPLQVGQSYTASITTNGNTYTWTFTTVASPVTIHEEAGEEDVVYEIR